MSVQPKGTTFYKPEVDTIFELGGQDAKFTSLRDGFLVDFRMNKVCAAGTGSFLEETAKKLGISISGEYESLAMAAKTPLKLAERCAVYMESDLMSQLQMGVGHEDLLAGLSRAVVHNYLNRVVQDGKIGEIISFQGGPSLNKSVVAAFEAVIGKPVLTLQHREVIGAIGAALHALEEVEMRRNVDPGYVSKFKGWDIIAKNFSHSEEICYRTPNCHNQCKLQVYTIGEEEAVYGG
ncbi:CoA activase, partial [bacterium]|nr:CoA activase [bacterium]